MSQKTDFITSIKEDFAAVSQARAAVEPDWLKGLRETAFARFESMGIPTTKHEDWKYFSLKKLTKKTFPSATQTQGLSISSSDLSAKYPGSFGKYNVVFVDGHFDADLSSLEGLPKGITASSLQDALQGEQADAVKTELMKQLDRNDLHVFSALNLAMFSGGAWVSVAKNAVVEEPIHMVYLSTAKGEEQAHHTRSLIVAEANSQASFTEHFVSLEGGSAWTNAVTEFVVAENAHIDHVKVQEENQETFHISNMQVEQARSSTFASCAFSLGGLLVRNDIGAALLGEGIECTLNGFFSADGEQVVDNHTFIDHAFPHCNSYETYKGVLDGKGSGVFNGKILVRQDAQKTDAKQNNQALLLSDDAQMSSKPQLEIFADDVKCTHGATSGFLNKEAMFYLQARGIPKSEARGLLTFAFANDVVGGVKHEALREYLENFLILRFRDQ